MASKFVTNVESILSKYPDKQFTAKELANLILNEGKSYLSKRKDFGVKTTEQLQEQLVREIYAANSSDSFSENIKATSDTPKKFYFYNTKEQDIIESDVEETSLQEKELYPILCEYLSNVLRIYPKRIDEKRSSNTYGKNGNKWLHPDIVGLQIVSESWNEEVKKCIKLHGEPQISLWSFEVKRKITRSNVRKTFFQTVSNSSWANNSYLVAVDIEDKALAELQILCKGHKIGVIQLNTKDPNDSQIRIPAIEDYELDWGIINRICQTNTDFKDYVEKISEFYQTGKIKKAEWDINNKYD